MLIELGTGIAVLEKEAKELERSYINLKDDATYMGNKEKNHFVSSYHLVKYHHFKRSFRHK